MPEIFLVFVVVGLGSIFTVFLEKKPKTTADQDSDKDVLCEAKRYTFSTIYNLVIGCV